jgi:hypothetical protein
LPKTLPQKGGGAIGENGSSKSPLSQGKKGISALCDL